MKYMVNGLIFSSEFDSGNLSHVQASDSATSDIPCTSSKINCKSGGNIGILTLNVDHDLKVWTSPDCYGTEFENSNRTWFYFSVSGYTHGKSIRITIMNLNKQAKIYAEGYTVVYKVCGSKLKESSWTRIRDRPAWTFVDGEFRLTFVHQFAEEKDTTTYFAFSYPWSYKEHQMLLDRIENVLLREPIYVKKKNSIREDKPESREEFSDLYFHRELLCYSLDGKRVDLLTITDWSGQLNEREEYFDVLLFPDRTKPRPWKFENKKVVFLTARVHPGETPSSHVFNGVLELLLRPNDARARELRRQYVFKLIPMLNPDGVARGHYRTDSRGVNLNRVYLAPDFLYHPSIYATKALLVYHHTLYGTNKPYARFLNPMWSKFLNYYQASSQQHATNISGLSTESSPAAETTETEETSSHSLTSEESDKSPIRLSFNGNDDGNPRPPVTARVEGDMMQARGNGAPGSEDEINSITKKSSSVEGPVSPEALSTSPSLSMSLAEDENLSGSKQHMWTGSLERTARCCGVDMSRENSLMGDESISFRKSSALESSQDISPEKAGDLEHPSLSISTTTSECPRVCSSEFRKVCSERQQIVSRVDTITVRDQYMSSRIMQHKKLAALTKSVKSPRIRGAKIDCLPHLFHKWMEPIRNVLIERKCSSSKHYITTRESSDSVRHKGKKEAKSGFYGKLGRITVASSNVYDWERFDLKMDLPGNYSRASVHVCGRLYEQQVVPEELNQDLDSCSAAPGNEGSDLEEIGTNHGLTKPSNDNPEVPANVNPVFAYIRAEVQKFWQCNVKSSFEALTLEDMLKELDKLRMGHHLADPELLEVKERSGVDVYVDLHAHCSKRGCFFYGNDLPSEDDMVDNVLLAVLLGVNSPYFDFGACNFTERNMYQPDRTGTFTKEGSGRVAIWKHLGVVHSYTLECNYNAGPLFNRLSRYIAAGGHENKGRVTPPGELIGPHWSDIIGPLRLHNSKNETGTANTVSVNGSTATQTSHGSPRFSPAHFESVGRALLFAILDLRQINPWPRLSTLGGPNAVPGVGTSCIPFGFPEFTSMKTLRDWTRKVIRGSVDLGGRNSIGQMRRLGKMPVRRRTVESIQSPRTSPQEASSQPTKSLSPISIPSRTIVQSVQTKTEMCPLSMGNRHSMSPVYSTIASQALTSREESGKKSVTITLSNDVKRGACISPIVFDRDSNPENSIGEGHTLSIRKNIEKREVSVRSQQSFGNSRANPFRGTNESNTIKLLKTTQSIPVLSKKMERCHYTKPSGSHRLTWPQKSTKSSRFTSLISPGCSLLSMTPLAIELPESTPQWNEELPKQRTSRVVRTSIPEASAGDASKNIKNGKLTNGKRSSISIVAPIKPDVRPPRQTCTQKDCRPCSPAQICKRFRLRKLPLKQGAFEMNHCVNDAHMSPVTAALSNSKNKYSSSNSGSSTQGNINRHSTRACAHSRSFHRGACVAHRIPRFR